MNTFSANAFSSKDLPQLLPRPDETEPKYVIFDTDAGPDGDDTAALTMLLHYAAEDRVKLLAAVSDTSSPYGATYLSALNRYYGFPEIPIGTLKSKPDIMPTSRGNNFNIRLTAEYETAFPDGEHAPDALSVYRRALAGAA